MISVVNHPLPLSGSEFLRKFSVLFFVLILVSCGTTRQERSAPAEEVIEKAEDTDIAIEEVEWKEGESEGVLPLTYPDDSPYRARMNGDLPDPELKNTYHITLVLTMDDWPEDLRWEDFVEDEDEEEFLLEEEEEKEVRLHDYLNEEAIGFLNGFEKSFTREKGLTVDFKIEVVAGGDPLQPKKLGKKLGNLKYPPDLIIGTGGRDQLEFLSAFAAENGAVLVNPNFIGNFQVARNNQAVSFQPDLLDHFYAVINRLDSMGPEDRFFIISSPRERERVNRFRELFEFYFPDRIFGEIHFDSDEDILEFDFEEFFDEEGSSKTFFFLPMTRNHPFIYPILRAIDLTKTSDKYEVIGLTLWDREIQIEFHHKLNLINTSGHIAISGNEDFRAFSKEFFRNYEYIGGRSEYEGNLTAGFVKRHLMTYGVDFPYYLPFTEPVDFYYRWQFRRDLTLEDFPDFGDLPPNLRNMGVYLLRLEDGKFVVVQ